MIKHVHIRNYKSVQELRMACKRYNVFIGDTSTGKSNILEALSLFSQNNLRSTQQGGRRSFDERIIRYERLSELFTNKDTTEALVVEADAMTVRGEYVPDMDQFHFAYKDLAAADALYKFQPAGNQVDMVSGKGISTPFRRYQYDANVKFGPLTHPHLLPSDGSNLAAVLLKVPELLAEIGEIMAAKDIAISIDRDSYAISQRVDITPNVAVHLSWSTISETIRRYVFLYSAIRTNPSAVLLLDEPEQNTFPFYTAHIAEIMARDTGNQYFITTHNQYLLSALVDKAPESEIQVFATYRKDGYTAVRAIPMAELQELMQYDLFLNLDKLAEV
jgi:AAA15 family ATPase/GTPase